MGGLRRNYLDPPFKSKRFYSVPIGSRAAGSSFKDNPMESLRLKIETRKKMLKDKIIFGE